ncbi:hypothetical protein DAPPUDRAFT_320484 [Daphnia pulex]|uniref:DDE-1 domain-containing protein n=1 Tax=Daphnia pulex TaxID=6669 RepID=E9GPZ1_DAPPU|nr:hypothetical protein DAPPUDRAFT_320484 [Daphnia pulex]|eukprot:EFX78509.1 hypothetical protein DAPPUDRAFT_320484 [Daphnia pulex]
MDNHLSHLHYDAVKFAKENGIILLTFPPHCSHTLQPLDVCVYSPFKRALGASHNDWLQFNPGKRITVKEIEELTRPAYVGAFTPAIIILAFWTTGIEPFNRFAIPDERYAPSLVTDRDCPIVIPTLVPDLSSDSIESIRPPVPGPSTDFIELIPPPVTDLSNDFIELIPPPKPYVQIIQVKPYPKAIKSGKVRVTKARVGKSRVLTDSPEKDEIEQGRILRKNQVQSESLTEKNETPMVCMDKKKSRKFKEKDNISNKENETPVPHVEKKKSRKSQVQENTSNKENVTPVANSVICNKIVDVCSTDKVQRSRSGSYCQKGLVNEYD